MNIYIHIYIAGGSSSSKLSFSNKTPRGGGGVIRTNWKGLDAQCKRHHGCKLCQIDLLAVLVDFFDKFRCHICTCVQMYVYIHTKQMFLQILSNMYVYTCAYVHVAFSFRSPIIFTRATAGSDDDVGFSILTIPVCLDCDPVRQVTLIEE